MTIVIDYYSIIEYDIGIKYVSKILKCIVFMNNFNHLSLYLGTSVKTNYYFLFIEIYLYTIYRCRYY